MGATISQAAGVLKLTAPGKINLALRVVGPRPDGYHELVSVVTAVTLVDELSVSARSAPGIELISDVPGFDVGEANLIVRAAGALARRATIEPRLTIRLEKRIPVGGGMGGGSTDAACILQALNRWWELGWSTEALASLAAELGSDVPMFLYGDAAVLRGRGERVEPIEWRWPGWFLLLAPDFGVSTARVYQAWSASPTRSERDPLAVIGASDAAAGVLRGLLFNDLQEPACRVESRLRALLGEIHRTAGVDALVSGSGSTCFALFDERDAAEHAAAELAKGGGLRSWVVRAVGAESQGRGVCYGNHRG